MQGDSGSGGDDWSATSQEAAIELYLKEVAKYQPLAPRVEANLLGKGRDGDHRAMGTVIRSHLQRAAMLAFECAPASVARVEAIQEANAIAIRLLCNKEITDPTQAIEAAIRARWSKTTDQ